MHASSKVLTYKGRNYSVCNSFDWSKRKKREELVWKFATSYEDRDS